MRVGVARLSNLRQLDTPEEGESRPSRFGLNDRVRLLRLNWWENRMNRSSMDCCAQPSDPPPTREAGGLAAALAPGIPECPDPGVVDQEAAPLAVDANAPVADRRRPGLPGSGHWPVPCALRVAPSGAMACPPSAPSAGARAGGRPHSHRPTGGPGHRRGPEHRLWQRTGSGRRLRWLRDPVAGWRAGGDQRPVDGRPEGSWPSSGFRR